MSTSDPLSRTQEWRSVAILALGFGLIGASGPALFSWPFAVHFLNNALIARTVGPIATEAVAPALMTTASGMVSAAGELLGGDLASIFGGQVAERVGIDHVLWPSAAMMAVAIVLRVALSETRGRRA